MGGMCGVSRRSTSIHHPFSTGTGCWMHVSIVNRFLQWQRYVFPGQVLIELYVGPAAHCGKDVFNSQLNRSRICTILSSQTLHKLHANTHSLIPTKRALKQWTACTNEIRRHCAQSIRRRHSPFTERKIDFSDIEFSFAFRFDSIFNCGRYSSLFLFPYHHHHPSLSSRRSCLSGVSHAAISTVTVAHGLKWKSPSVIQWIQVHERIH